MSTRSATRFVTLKSSDPAYENYLWGDMPEVALPIKSYNLGTEEESVTFEIKNKNEINWPGWPRFFTALIKLRTYILVMLPMFFILCKHAASAEFDIVSYVSACVGVLLLYAGFNIRNDVSDHISGFDRVNLDSTKKPIRLGWISARKAKQISNFTFAAAAIAAAPSLLLHPVLTIILSLVVIFTILAKFAKNNSYKNQLFGEMVLLNISGPALMYGLDFSAGASRIDGETGVFGALWGLIVLFIIDINNFSHIMTSSQNRIKNTVTKLGFDRAQKYLVRMWGAILIIWAIYTYNFQNYTVNWVFLAVVTAASVLFLKNVIHIKSPMGSGLKSAKAAAHKLFLLVTFVIFLQSLNRWLQVI
ncbi:MAG: 1,4-dihydroxy-2-naphthoate octaprenyltransferase [Pseudobdellovibrio sp.]|jgi:1,4-dihydroxy-2-naphthoate octaprenyltransferase|nr:1,4-dihydroxy-2-naphthoate octaprenyltransferase [Pseudobdellovibrio sp.]